MPRSQTAALPRHQKEEETNKCPNSFTQGLLWDGGINVCGALENIKGTNDEGNTEGFEICFKVFPP